MLRTENHAIRTLNRDLTKPYALEADLIRRAVAGESEAFCELVRPCERAVFMSAFAILQNQEDAEDAAQEAVFKAFARLSKFRGESKFSTWFFRIVINESLVRLRKGRRQLQESLDEPYQNENGDSVLRDFADWRPIPSKELENEELRKMLHRALASLRPKYRSTLILRDVQQLSIAETAALLGVKPCAVKARLFRARLQMRAALARVLSSGREKPTQIQTAHVTRSDTVERSANGRFYRILGRTSDLERAPAT